MSEMIIQSPEIKKILFDYDITFTTGMIMPLTLDPTLGDTIDLSPTVIQVHLEPKPSLSDPTVTLPAEDITIFTNHILSIQKRKREITDLSPDERLQWKKVMAELSNAIN